MVGATIGSSLFSAGTTDFTGPNQPSSEQDNRNFSLQLTPSIGWFLSHQTVAGASLLVSISNQRATSKSGGVTYKEDNYKNLDFGAGGFVRHYLNSTATLRPFAHIHLTAGSGSTTTDGFWYYTEGSPPATVKETYEGKSTGRFFYNAGVNGGFTKMLSQYAGLDFYIGYLYSFSKRTTNTTEIEDHTAPSPDIKMEYETTQKFTGHGLAFGIGFQVFLSRK